MFESKFTTERAWKGGPLRKVGSGVGKPSKYVCGGCKRSAVGVYLVEPYPQAREWVCNGCRKKLGTPIPHSDPRRSVLASPDL